MINVTNLKTRIQVLFEIELEAWENGEREWNVGNQHDTYTIESALEGLENGKLEAFVERFPSMNVDGMTVMGWAHSLAEHKTPELDPIWYD